MVDFWLSLRQHRNVGVWILNGIILIIARATAVIHFGRPDKPDTSISHKEVDKLSYVLNLMHQ